MRLLPVAVRSSAAAWVVFETSISPSSLPGAARCGGSHVARWREAASRRRCSTDARVCGNPTATRGRIVHRTYD